MRKKEKFKMKANILTKLTSLMVSFALCLSALPSRGFFADAKTYVEEAYGLKHYGYNFESIKDMFHDIIYSTTYNKNPDEILANGDKKHKERNNFISKIVFSIGAAVIAAKLAWNLHKIHKGNKNTSEKEKENKNKKYIDGKSFWAKVKNKLGIFKDKFLIFTALITLCTNLLIRYLNDYFYSLKHEEISKFLSKEKDRYFDYLEKLFKLTCEYQLINKIWYLTYREKNFEGEEIKFLHTICPYMSKKVNCTEEEKAKFENDLEEIRTEINKIFRKNGMKEFSVKEYVDGLKKSVEEKQVYFG